MCWMKDPSSLRVAFFMCKGAFMVLILCIIESTLAWVRLPNVRMHYWDPNCLEDVVAPIGKFIRLDGATLLGTQGLFARICVELDLRVPLKRSIVIHVEGEDDERVRTFVPYEGLFAVCFQCGSHRHRINRSPLHVREEDFLLMDRNSDDDEVEPADKELPAGNPSSHL